MARSLRSRHDICWFLKHRGEVSTNLGKMEDISPRSRRDLECHEHHGEISTISARSWQVLGNLGKMEDISPRSRRDLESNKHHGEISARSHQSQRDHRRDLSKNFAREGLRNLQVLLLLP